MSLMNCTFYAFITCLFLFSHFITSLCPSKALNQVRKKNNVRCLNTSYKPSSAATAARAVSMIDHCSSFSAPKPSLAKSSRAHPFVVLSSPARHARQAAVGSPNLSQPKPKSLICRSAGLLSTPHGFEVMPSPNWGEETLAQRSWGNVHGHTRLTSVHHYCAPCSFGVPLEFLDFHV